MTALIVVPVTPRDVSPPLFLGAGATQYGPPVVVTIGNVPRPCTVSGLHFGFSTAAFVPIPAPGGGFPTPPSTPGSPRRSALRRHRVSTPSSRRRQRMLRRHVVLS